MFEFIGVVVTVIIVFKLIKGVFKGATKGTLLRACELAQSKGVPHEFALKAIRNPDELINIRKSLAQENREFGGLDVYEQYGAAIIMAYRWGVEETALESSKELGSIKEMLEKFLRPQIDILEREGLNVVVNDITFVYVRTLVTCMTKKSVSLLETKELIEHVFCGEKDLSQEIENAFSIVKGSSDFIEKCKDAYPMVSKEVEYGKGVFFVKYTRKLNVEIEKIFEPDPDFDPRNVSRASFLEV